MAAYTPVIAAPARQLLTHVEDACHIGMESIDLLAALLYAVEQLGSQPGTTAAGHTKSLMLIATHLMEDYRNTLDSIREDSRASLARPRPAYPLTARTPNA